MPTNKTIPTRAITVQELRDMLENYPPDMPMVFAYPSGDYWKTEIAAEITDVEEGNVEYTDYHQKFKPVDDNDDDEAYIKIKGKYYVSDDEPTTNDRNKALSYSSEKDAKEDALIIKEQWGLKDTDIEVHMENEPKGSTKVIILR